MNLDRSRESAYGLDRSRTAGWTINHSRIPVLVSPFWTFENLHTGWTFFDNLARIMADEKRRQDDFRQFLAKLAANY